jgi:MOSC domain-containing protein YiiM
MAFNGRVEAIFITPAKGDAAVGVDSVNAVEGQGLEGDRYHAKAGTFSAKEGPGRQVTLIEAEAIEAVRAGGMEFGLGESRRNIVTRDVPLNHLVGREFTVGAARLRGVKLCEPCNYLEEVTGKEVRLPLLHRGGLRAEILAGGPIAVGDAVHPA